MGINQFSDGTKFTPGIMRPIVPEKNVPFYVATNETWALYKKRFNKNSILKPFLELFKVVFHFDTAVLKGLTLHVKIN